MMREVKALPGGWMPVALGTVTRTLAFILSEVVFGAPDSVFSVSFPRQIYL